MKDEGRREGPLFLLIFPGVCYAKIITSSGEACAWRSPGAFPERF